MNTCTPARIVLVVFLLVAIIAAPAYAATIQESQKPFFDLIRASEAQQITKGEGVIVAVIDSGVDAGHPDLAGALLPGYHVNKNSAEAAHTDPEGHGTIMAGIIIARGGGPNNALGIAPQAKVLPVGMNFGLANAGDSLSKAIRWAVDHDADIINMSLTRPAYERLTRQEIEAIAYAQAKDVVLIATAGNVKNETGGNNIAALPGVLAVAATTLSGGGYRGSEVRDYNAIAAPGEDIITTGARHIHSTGFAADTGTSPAAAIVSGVAALVQAKYPDMDAANIVNRLIKTAVDKGDPGRDPVFGYGIVDAHAALTANVPAVKENPLGVTKDPDNAQQQAGTATSAGKKNNAVAAIAGLAFWVAVIVGVIFVVRHRRKKRQIAQAISAAPPAGPYQGATAAPPVQIPPAGPGTVPVSPQTPPPPPPTVISPQQGGHDTKE